MIINIIKIIAIVIAVTVYILITAYNVWKFVKQPTAEQLATVKSWLLYACTEAEKELGSGTGSVKLAYVFDKFQGKFGDISKFISYDEFSNMVDDVLEKFKNMLASNTSLQGYVNGTATKESDKS